MRLIYLLLLLSGFAFAQKKKPLEPAYVTESFKLVNDLNAAEKKPAIYMCRDLNNLWNDYLTEPKTEDVFEKSKFQRRLDTISKYIGGNPETWKKSVLNIESWQPRVKAAEYVNYRNLDIDDFYKKHNRTGVYLYSPPLFDESKTKAIVYVWYITGRNVILDNYYYCEKSDGNWARKSIVLIGGFNNY